MLGKAVNKYEASKPAPKPASNSNASKSALAKQLFPSSSPSSSSQDANIIQSFRHGSSRQGFSRQMSTASTATASSRTTNTNTNTTNPLSTSSNNISRLHSRAPSEATSYTSYNSVNSVATLCNGAGDFTDEVLSAPVPAAGGTHTKPDPSVYISVDDFSDDENLELDYECPASLPALPSTTPSATASVTTSAPGPVLRTPTGPSPARSVAPSSTQMAWSSSPQWHLHPPNPPRSIKHEPSDEDGFFPPPNPHKRIKRELSDDPPVQAPPAVKRRELPPSYKREDSPEPKIKYEAQESRTGKTSQPISTPAPKKTQLWDMTQSAIKERQGKLKAATKKSGSDNSSSAAQTGDSADGQSRAKASAISLSSEQQHVIDLVIHKKQSVFFTGPAGTGKSVLMRAIIQELKKQWVRDPERLSVTASTGLAACNIGGMTLHSFAGIGLGKEDVQTLVKKIRRNPKAKNRWLRTKTLVIDEVSMVDGDLFDKLSQIARLIRNNGRPWGGIQLVITGDFFQLPPVPDSGGREIKFAFEAATWNTSIDHTIGLTQVFRQKDPKFAAMLNEMRLGRISNDTIATFRKLSRPLSMEDGLAATELFPTRQEVDRSNESRLRNLPGAVRRYDATDTGDPNIRDKLLQNMMAPKAIDLKKGAQVMLIKNMDESLVNGSLGKVVGFASEAAFAFYGTSRDEKDGSGDEGEANPVSKKTIQSFTRDTGSMKDLKEYPIVQFTAIDGTHRIILCVTEDWKVELPNGEVQAQRTQIPLILAWALSIHKAQGQTLERVKVDLGKVFEKGQAYVALSRATSQQGLQVLRFDQTKVLAHPRVITFYNKLYSAESAAVKAKKPPSTVSDFAYGATSAPSGGRKGASKQVVRATTTDEEEAMAAAWA